MNLELPFRKRQAGISLLEALVYIACLSVLLTLLSVSVWKLNAFQSNIGERANNVGKLLDVGEMWRNEVRTASTLSDDAKEGMQYTKNGKACSYQVVESQLVQTTADQSQVLLKNVVSSMMSPQERDGVRYWQWDVSVATGKRGGVLTFSFMAVPKGAK